MFLEVWRQPDKNPTNPIKPIQPSAINIRPSCQQKAFILLSTYFKEYMEIFVSPEVFFNPVFTYLFVCLFVCLS